MLAVDGGGATALMLAAGSRSCHAVSLLLEAHADVSARDAHGRGAMMHALTATEPGVLRGAQSAGPSEVLPSARPAADPHPHLTLTLTLT